MSVDQSEKVKEIKMVKCPICRKNDIEKGEECCDDPKCKCVNGLTRENQIKVF